MDCDPHNFSKSYNSREINIQPYTTPINLLYQINVHVGNETASSLINEDIKD